MIVNLHYCCVQSTNSAPPCLLKVTATVNLANFSHAFCSSIALVTDNAVAIFNESFSLPFSNLSLQSASITLSFFLVSENSTILLDSLSISLFKEGSFHLGHQILFINISNSSFLLPFSSSNAVSSSSSSLDPPLLPIILTSSSPFLVPFVLSLSASHSFNSFDHYLEQGSKFNTLIEPIIFDLPCALTGTNQMIQSTFHEVQNHDSAYVAVKTFLDNVSSSFHSIELPEKLYDFVWKLRQSELILSSEFGLALVITSIPWDNIWKMEVFIQELIELNKKAENYGKYYSLKSLFHAISVFSENFKLITSSTQTNFSLFNCSRNFSQKYCKELFSLLCSFLLNLLSNNSSEFFEIFTNPRVIIPPFLFLLPLSCFFDSSPSSPISLIIQFISDLSFNNSLQIYWMLRSEEKKLALNSLYNGISVFLKRLRRQIIRKLNPAQVEQLFAQKELISHLRGIAITAKGLNYDESAMLHVTKSTKVNVELLTTMLRDKVSSCVSNLTSGQSIVLPFHNQKSVVNSGQVKVFGSQMKPVFVSFLTPSNQSVAVIFKVGDDLRNDSFSLGLIELMDQLLLQSGTLKKSSLVKYDVIPTGHNEGLIEVIPDVISMSSVTEISDYINSNTKLTDFISSLAVSSVLSFILGVADRHLDNILLCIDGVNNGKVVHIDYGYIFGIDPKLFQPAIRLVPDWVIAMKERFSEFQNICISIYLSLRKHSSFVLSYIACCLDSRLQSIEVLGRDNIIELVASKFSIGSTDEEACALILDEIERAYRSVWAKLNETAHRFATSTK
ncbi:hypothetical protein RCL1_001276 [Eukaryota sp. TZLM3-RCL]